MKYLVLLLIALLFVTGCIQADLHSKIYDEDGNLKSDISVSHNMANVNEKTGNALIRLADGTIIWIIDNDVLADPNSALAEKELVEAIMSFGMSGTLKEIVK